MQCPEAPTQADRKNIALFVTIDPEQAKQLQTPQYQLRLFCTTMEAHAASLSGRNPATVEFPLTCEARVNGQPLSINLRGSKKNIGRVPPPNLNKDKMLSMATGRPNRIELTYTNAPKRHVLVAAICEVTSVETLVERLRSKQLKSKEDLLSRMRQEAEDDDIEAGAATMSLKCPLSYMRITTPCRSTHCSHVQCFDAYSFFSVNEQSPSWACPVCHKNIKVEDLFMDGYVNEILQKVPQDEESVIVEPDGSWRTSDGKISSSGTAQATPAAEGTPLQDRLLGRESEETKPSIGGSAKPNGATRASPEEIVLLDSPSPPEDPAPTTAAPTAAASTSATTASTSTQPATASTSTATGQPTRSTSGPSSSTQALAPPAASSLRHDRIELLSSSNNTSARNSPVVGAGDVIDLTLDSDDDEPVVPTRSTAPSNGGTSHAQPNGTSQAAHTSNHTSSTTSSTNGSRGAFANYSTSTAATPNRTGPFAAAMARVEATPEDEQIRRPGKRPRTDIPTPTDPRLVNGRRPGSTAVAERRANVILTTFDTGANGSRSNGSTEGTTAASGGGGTRTAYRDPAAGRGAGDNDEGDDSWMDNANSDQEQYLNEDDWWP